MTLAPPGMRSNESLDDAALIRQFGGALPLPAPQGRERLSAWLAEVAPSDAGATLTALIEEYPSLASVLAAIAAAAPYLWDLVRADPARAVRTAVPRSARDADRACSARRARPRRRRAGPAN